MVTDWLHVCVKNGDMGHRFSVIYAGDDGTLYRCYLCGYEVLVPYEEVEDDNVPE